MSLGSMEQRTGGMKRQAQELIEQAYNRGYTAGYSKAENDYYAKTEDDRQSSYELGLNMAWEAARKLVFMDYRECNKVLGYNLDSVNEIFVRCTASEAIERLKAYEKHKSKDFRVGDIVKMNGHSAVITWCDGDNWNGICVQGSDNSEVGMTYHSMKYDGWTKTGETIPEIVKVLRK